MTAALPKRGAPAYPPPHSALLAGPAAGPSAPEVRMITPPADGLADGPMDIDTIPMLVVQAIRAARSAGDAPAPLPGLGAPGPLEAHLADYPLPVLHLLGVLYIIGRQGKRPETLAGLLAGPAQAWPTVTKAAAALARKRHLADCLSRALVEIGPGDLEAFFGEA